MCVFLLLSDRLEGGCATHGYAVPATYGHTARDWLCNDVMLCIYLMVKV